MAIKKCLLGIILMFSFIGFVYGQGNDPNEISEDNMKLIQEGTIISLQSLETTDKEKFNVIIKYLPKNYNIADYYYDIGITMMFGEYQKYYTLESYYEINDLPQYKDDEIEFIHYNITYYERLFNKYSSYRGDPTRKYFVILFDKNNRFVKRVGVR